MFKKEQKKTLQTSMEGFLKSLHTLFIVSFSNGLFCCGIVKEERNSFCCAIKPTAADYTYTCCYGGLPTHVSGL